MAAMAIANIATNVRNQARMLKMGILEPIESLARVGLDPKGKGGGRGGTQKNDTTLYWKRTFLVVRLNGALMCSLSLLSIFSSRSLFAPFSCSLRSLFHSQTRRRNRTVLPVGHCQHCRLLGKPQRNHQPMFGHLDWVFQIFRRSVPSILDVCFGEFGLGPSKLGRRHARGVFETDRLVRFSRRPQRPSTSLLYMLVVLVV